MGTHDLLVDSEQRHKNRVRQAGRTSGGLALGSDATVGMLQALQRTAGNAAVNVTTQVPSAGMVQVLDRGVPVSAL